MSYSYAFSVGVYVRSRMGRKGRITRRESGLYEVAWTASSTRDWALPEDLTPDYDAPVAYGWEVRAKMGPPDFQERTFVWRGLSEAAARRRAVLKGQGVEILSVLPITHEQWIRAYGDPDIAGDTRRAMS